MERSKSGGLRKDVVSVVEISKSRLVRAVREPSKDFGGVLRLAA